MPGVCQASPPLGGGAIGLLGRGGRLPAARERLSLSLGVKASNLSRCCLSIPAAVHPPEWRLQVPRRGRKTRLLPR